MKKKSEIISVGNTKFKMILTYEEDGYYFIHRKYDLFCGKTLIGKNIGSIKQCYYKAYLFTEQKSIRHQGEQK